MSFIGWLSISLDQHIISKRNKINKLREENGKNVFYRNLFMVENQQAAHKRLILSQKHDIVLGLQDGHSLIDIVNIRFFLHRFFFTIGFFVLFDDEKNSKFIRKLHRFFLLSAWYKKVPVSKIVALSYIFITLNELKSHKKM